MNPQKIYAYIISLASRGYSYETCISDILPELKHKLPFLRKKFEEGYSIWLNNHHLR